MSTQNAQALAVHLLKQGKPLGEIGEATGLMDKEVLAIAKSVSQQVGTAQTTAPQPMTVAAARHATTGSTRAPEHVPVPSPIARLLEDAGGHSKARVRTLAARIEADLDRLRELIAEHAEAEKARRLEQQAKEAARAEVKRLEAQLAEAKARLRGSKPVATTGAVTAPSNRTAPQPCRKCGVTCKGAQGRAAHEQHCTGAAA